MVKDDPVDDACDPGRVTVSWRGAEDQAGAISLPDDESVTTRAASTTAAAVAAAALVELCATCPAVAACRVWAATEAYAGIAAASAWVDGRPRPVDLVHRQGDARPPGRPQPR